MRRKQTASLSLHPCLHLSVIPRLWSSLNQTYIYRSCYNGPLTCISLPLFLPPPPPSPSNSHLLLLKHVRSHFLQSPLCVFWRKGRAGLVFFSHREESPNGYMHASKIQQWIDMKWLFFMTLSVKNCLYTSNILVCTLFFMTHVSLILKPSSKSFFTSLSSHSSASRLVTFRPFWKSSVKLRVNKDEEAVHVFVCVCVLEKCNSLLSWQLQ